MNNFREVYFQIQKSDITFKPLGAVICYVFLIFLLDHFIISKNKSIFEAFMLGLCVYGVYGSTNYAVINDYPLKLMVTDTLWGGVLFALTTYLYRLILRQFL